MHVPAGGTRDSDRTGGDFRILSGRIANTIAFVLMFLAVVGVFLFIHGYGLNILYDDQWMDVALVHKALHGTLTLADLWAQHNENRILVPNLVVVAIGETTHLQVLVEEYLSGVALCVSTALLVLAHRRRSPETPWLVYCPVVAVSLSGAGVSDMLFGFNLSWYLVLLGLAVSVFLADKVVLSRLALIGAVAAAVAGSFSSLQGLLIWPAILVLLWIRKRSFAVLAVWMGSAAVTAAAYFVNFDFARTGSSGHVRIGSASSYFVTELGNVLGGQTSRGGAWQLGGFVLACIFVALAVGLRRSAADGAGIGVALVLFGLAFDASAAVGRSQLGLVDAKRYAPFALTVWCGAYLVLVSWALRRRRLGTGTGVASGADPPKCEYVPARIALVAVMILAMGSQVLLSWSSSDARGWRSEELTIANVTANIRQTPDAVVATTLGTYPVPLIRKLVGYAREDRLSLFGTSLAAEQIHRGLDPYLMTTLVSPSKGQRLTGRVILDAGVAGNERATVVFQVLGPDARVHDLATATPTIAGYLARWDTTTVRNGWHYLRSRALLPDGLYVSRWIGVYVTNR